VPVSKLKFRIEGKQGFDRQPEPSAYRLPSESYGYSLVTLMKVIIELDTGESFTTAFSGAGS